MSNITKAELGRAGAAIRELSDIIERLEKATWPLSSQNDVLRKADLLDDTQPRASLTADAAAKALSTLAGATSRIERLEAGRDCDAQYRKTAVR